MRIIKATGKNFQSYKDVEFTYENLGLSLISGESKAGKSTVMDLSCWGLTGTTSKDSAADDVKSWFSEGEATEVTVEVELPTGTIYITRVRGTRPSLNDLFYQTSVDGEKLRGKDAKDTQETIYSLLGITADLLINGSYLHQFSKADQFFVSKAKDRRETFERIVNLDLPIKLSESTSEARKVTKTNIDKAGKVVAKAEGELNSLIEAAKRTQHNRSEWTAAHVVRVRKAEQAIEDWNALKVKREASALAMIESWDTQRSMRADEAELSSKGYEDEKFAKASKIADQLTELDKTIIEPESFQKQQAQVKQQLKAIELIEVDLKAAEMELHVTKLHIEQLRGEYQSLDSLAGTCPTCLGPADNEHSQTRKSAIEVEIVECADRQESLTSEIKLMRLGVSQKPNLMESIQSIFKKEIQNKALIEKAQTLRTQVTVLRAEKNPYTGQLQKIEAEKNPYLAQLGVISAEQNPYTNQYAAVVQEQNPFDSAGDQNQLEVDRLTQALQVATVELTALERELSGLNWLYDKSYELRGRLLEQMVKQLETKTNEYLEKYFEADLRVKFQLESSDKVEVSITNEGYNCPYGQLSGAERCLLKLAFGIPYMKAVSDRAGTEFNVLMLDEALNGFSASLKVKAFTLLQSLEQNYETILLIDHHEEFKNMFTKRFSVTKSGSYSSIELEPEE